MDRKFSVAIHILLFLATTDEQATSQRLAESVGTNGSFIRKMMSPLKEAGLIESSQGQSGFVLKKVPKDIYLSDVYQALNPEKALLHTHEHPNPACPLGKRVLGVIQPVFSQVDKRFLASLEEISLQQLIDDLYQKG